MYIVNTTFLVGASVHEPFLESIRREYIPLLAREGYPEPVFTRLISAEATGEFTYSLQVRAASPEAFRHLSEQLLEAYAASVRERFGEQVLWFTSLLKRVDYK